MPTDKPRKTVTFSVNAWFDEDDGHIHLAGRNGYRFVTTVSNDPAHLRGHPHLFRHLAKCLTDAGLPHPPIAEER